jgi:hypothetical protein
MNNIYIAIIGIVVALIVGAYVTSNVMNSPCMWCDSCSSQNYTGLYNFSGDIAGYINCSNKTLIDTCKQDICNRALT